MKLIMNSKWMFMDAIGFHKKVIYFEVPKKCPNKEAEQRILQIITKLIVRGKKFFDFIYKLDFRMLEDSEFGVIFRYVDAYNYYAFIINNKRISAVKIKEGEVTEIGFIILEASRLIEKKRWYNVVLTVIKNTFKICYNAEGDYQLGDKRYNEMPK